MIKKSNFKKEINNFVTNKKEEELVKIIEEKFDDFIKKLKDKCDDSHLINNYALKEIREIIDKLVRGEE